MLHEMRLKKKVVGFYLVLLLSLFTKAAVAQEDGVLNRLYGSGVHAYNSGDYLEAYDYLTAAIDTGLLDPRAHYFRGLCYLKLGRREQAEQEFIAAARRELEMGNVTPAVDRSLLRIQGPDRYVLEGTRIEVQRGRAEKQSRMNRKRFSKPVQAKPGQDRPMEADSAESVIPIEGTERDGGASQNRDEGTLTEAEEESLLDTGDETSSDANQEGLTPNVFDQLLEEGNEEEGGGNPLE